MGGRSVHLILQSRTAPAAALFGLAGNPLRTVQANTRLILLAAAEETTSSLLRLRHERIMSLKRRCCP
jgi:hypothetical protein